MTNKKETDMRKALAAIAALVALLVFVTWDLPPPGASDPVAVAWIAELHPMTEDVTYANQYQAEGAANLAPRWLSGGAARRLLIPTERLALPGSRASPS